MDGSRPSSRSRIGSAEDRSAAVVHDEALAPARTCVVLGDMRRAPEDREPPERESGAFRVIRRIELGSPGEPLRPDMRMPHLRPVSRAVDLTAEREVKKTSALGIGLGLYHHGVPEIGMPVHQKEPLPRHRTHPPSRSVCMSVFGSAVHIYIIQSNKFVNAAWSLLQLRSMPGSTTLPLLRYMTLAEYTCILPYIL